MTASIRNTEMGSIPRAEAAHSNKSSSGDSNITQALGWVWAVSSIATNTLAISSLTARPCGTKPNYQVAVRDGGLAVIMGLFNTIVATCLVFYSHGWSRCASALILIFNGIGFSMGVAGVALAVSGDYADTSSC